MRKIISGTWFEFHHHNIDEGKYWNNTCREFTATQWEAKVEEIAKLGMKYIVLMASSIAYGDWQESYFETDIFPAAKMATVNPIDVLMSAAERNGIKVFMSAGFYGRWDDADGNMSSLETKKRAFRAMEQLYALYGKSPAFYGWYLPDEAWIKGYFSDTIINYINSYANFAHSLDSSKKILIAPYGTNMLIADDKYASQLEMLDCDFIAYQDEVGVEKSTVLETPKFYENLRRAHDKAGRAALWADVEMFRFEGQVYKSALLPADFSRIEKQLEAVTPYVDEILVYQYQGMFNPPDSKAFCGHPDSVKLYNEYTNWLKK